MKKKNAIVKACVGTGLALSLAAASPADEAETNKHTQKLSSDFSNVRVSRPAAAGSIARSAPGVNQAQARTQQTTNGAIERDSDRTKASAAVQHSRSSRTQQLGQRTEAKAASRMLAQNFDWSVMVSQSGQLGETRIDADSAPVSVFARKVVSGPAGTIASEGQSVRQAGQ